MEALLLIYGDPGALFSRSQSLDLLVEIPYLG
jgi:hypothetical protein